jgi:glycosyltransferase involved in cell wall biosynthesis
MVEVDLRPFAKSHAWMFMIDKLRDRIGVRGRTTWLEDRTLEDFGEWLSAHIGSIDILHALAGTGLEAGRRLRSEGRPWLCDRASTHIRTQKAILEAECDRWNVPLPYFSGGGMERAEAEYAESDAIAVPSEFVRRSFLDRGFPERKIVKCAFGVDLKQFRPERVEEPRDRLRVVFLGTASIRKGIGYLLQGLKPLADRRTIETWLIGSSHPDAAEILRRHAGEFRALGPFPRAELRGWLSRCDVLVLPSVEEGLAVVLAQAMACGLPVVATPNTGAEDLITDGCEGFVIPARSPEAIRERVSWLLDHPRERRGMGEAALRRVQGLGGWASYAAQMVDIYRSLVDPAVTALE